MKKQFAKFLLSSSLILLISFPLQAAEKLKMSSMAPGTSPYLIMTTMATMINQAQDDFEIRVDATGAVTKHMIELAQGKIDISLTSPVVYMWMKGQKAMYKKLKTAPELAKNLRLVFWFPLGQIHVVTYADSNIRSFEDLRGKRVFLGPPGGGAWKTSKTWVEACSGLKVHEDYKNVKASWSSAFQGFQDRQFDVFIIGSIAPFPQLEQLAMTSKLHLLGLTKEELEANPKAMKETTKVGREIGIITKGIYGEGVDNKSDVYTVGSKLGVTINKSMDDKTAYQLTKLFWEGVKTSRDTHTWLKSLKIDYAVAAAGMKLHPGAARYYKEQGVNIPAGSLK